MRSKGNRGFTLIEVIVVAGIIAILAGILVPLIFKEIDEAKITRATADMKSMQNAIMVFIKDTGSWPTKDSPTTNNCTMLFGQGNVVSFGAVHGWDDSTMSSFDDNLSVNTYLYNSWKGPYMASVTPDPWGHMYLCNIKDINDP